MAERIEPQPDRSGLVSVAGAVAVLVALLAFLPIVQGASWWTTSVAFVVVVTAVSAGARGAGLPVGAAGLVALSAIPLVATAVTGGGLLVLLPTAESAQRALDLLEAAGRQVYTDAVPAGDTEALALLIGLGAGVAAAIVDAVAVGLRAPIAGMLVVLALALVPGKALPTGTNGVLLVAVGAAVLLVIAADRRRRGSPPRLPGLAVGAGVAVVVALAAQVVLPAPVASQAQTGPVALFGSGADPLIRLGQNLRRGATTPVLRYTTGRGAETYLRLGVLEDLRGDTWAPNTAVGRVLPEAPPPAPGLSTVDVRDAVTTEIVPAAPDAVGERLPLPYPALAVDGVRAPFRWEERGLTLARTGSDPVAGYTVRTAQVDTTPATLRKASVSAPVGDEESLDLPRVPAIIRSTAALWTRGARSPYDEALAIQNRLRDGAFSYDEETPARQGYDGDGLGVIASFLRVKAGYCVHYASTMAVMARLRGIPSRIVVGYQPGEPAAGTRSRLVTSEDLHAWPELYFDGIGWVRFEPTPGRGAVPAYAPLPKVEGSTTPSATPSSAVQPSDRASDAAAAARRGGTDVGAIAQGVLRVGGVAALVALLLAVPGLVRRAIRRRRLGRLGADGAVGAWRELVDSIADLGLPTAEGRSPRDVEAVIGAHVGAGGRARAALERLRIAYERHAYGPVPAGASADDVRVVVRTAGERAGRNRRVLAAVAPRSLLAGLGRARTAFRWPSGAGRRPRAVRMRGGG